MGRHEGQAPEIDGQVYLSFARRRRCARPAPGTLVRAQRHPLAPNTIWPPTVRPSLAALGAAGPTQSGQAASSIIFSMARAAPTRTSSGTVIRRSAGSSRSVS